MTDMKRVTHFNGQCNDVDHEEEEEAGGGEEREMPERNKREAEKRVDERAVNISSLSPVPVFAPVSSLTYYLNRYYFILSSLRHLFFSPETSERKMLFLSEL